MYKFDYNNTNNTDNTDKSDKPSLSKKLKYTDLDTINRNRPELIMKQKSEFILHENFLLFPKKTLKKTEEYNLPIENKQTDNLEDAVKKPIIRIDGVDVGAGRGFGNLNISNDIRNGEDSRSQNNKFKKIKEAEVIDRFEFLDKDIQNPYNLILPFPRGGEITRKKPIIKKELDNKNFSFNYNE